MRVDAVQGKEREGEGGRGGGDQRMSGKRIDEEPAEGTPGRSGSSAK